MPPLPFSHRLEIIIWANSDSGRQGQLYAYQHKTPLTRMKSAKKHDRVVAPRDLTSVGQGSILRNLKTIWPKITPF